MYIDLLGEFSELGEHEILIDLNVGFLEDTSNSYIAMRVMS